MLITRFNPFRELIDLENRILNEYPVKKQNEELAAFTPSVNTREGEFAYHIDIDLPGVKKEDIKVDIKDNYLIVSGERNFKEEVKEEDYYKVETQFGKFNRKFTIPDHVDIENIEANSDNGVLELTLPKLPDVDKVKSIAVK